MITILLEINEHDNSCGVRLRAHQSTGSAAERVYADVYLHAFDIAQREILKLSGCASLMQAPHLTDAQVQAVREMYEINRKKQKEGS